MSDSRRVMAHRGASGHAPENTLAAMASACELGCTWVEFDVRLSRDDVPVLIHDATLKRTAGEDLRIEDVHSEDLGGIDAGSWFDPFWRDERIPTLAQALDACLVLGLTPNIEIKADTGQGMATAAAVARTVNERWPADRPRPLVSSFSFRTLYRFRFAGGRAALALLMWQEPRRFWTLHKHLLRAEAIHVDPSLMNKRLVARARARRCRVAVYTVNDPQEGQALYEAGADTLITNWPERFLETEGFSGQPVAESAVVGG